MMMELMYTGLGLVAGYFIAIELTKDRWVDQDTLRLAHWAMDEKSRWEVRTGRHLSLDELSAERAASAADGWKAKK